MKDLAAKAKDAAQDLAAKAGDAAEDVGGKSLQAGKEFLSGFGDKAQDMGAKGLQAGKEFLSNVGDKAQDLSEKGKLTLEIKKLEFQAEKLLEQLGAAVYDALVEQKIANITMTTPGIQEIFNELSPLQKEIDKKEAQIKGL
jgi:hypothetical protein